MDDITGIIFCNIRHTAINKNAYNRVYKVKKADQYKVFKGLIITGNVEKLSKYITILDPTCSGQLGIVKLWKFPQYFSLLLRRLDIYEIIGYNENDDFERCIYASWVLNMKKTQRFLCQQFYHILKKTITTYQSLRNLGWLFKLKQTNIICKIFKIVNFEDALRNSINEMQFDLVHYLLKNIKFSNIFLCGLVSGEPHISVIIDILKYQKQFQYESPNRCIRYYDWNIQKALFKLKNKTGITFHI
jgi:hypothetical protein